MTNTETIRKTFKYRCYPNKGTARRAQKTMRVYGDIWSNACAEPCRIKSGLSPDLRQDYTFAAVSDLDLRGSCNTWTR